MPETKNLTIRSLHTDYANRIIDVIGGDIDDYPATPADLVRLLHDASEDCDVTDQTQEFLDEAIADLNTITRLSDDSGKLWELLARIDSNMGKAVRDLEMG